MTSSLKSKETNQFEDHSEIVKLGHLFKRLSQATDMDGFLIAFFEFLENPFIDSADLITINAEMKDEFFRYEIASRWSSMFGILRDAIGDTVPFATYQPFFERRNPILSKNLSSEPELKDLAFQFKTEAEEIVSLAIFPLWVGEKQTGVLILRAHDSNAFSGLDIGFYELLVSILAVSIDHLHLTRQIQSSILENETLYLASSEVNRASTYHQILDLLIQYTFIKENLNSINLAIFDKPWTESYIPEWLETKGVWPEARSENVSNWMSLNQLPHWNKILRSDRLTLVGEGHPVLPACTAGVNDYLVRQSALAAVFVPLVANGNWIGEIWSHHDSPLNPSDLQIRQLMNLAGQAAVATLGLDNLSKANRSSYESSLLVQNSQLLTLAGSEKEILQIALRTCKQGVFLNSLSIHLISSDDGKHNLKLAAQLMDESIPPQREGSLYPARLFPFYDSFMAGQTITSNDIRLDERLNETARKYFTLSQIRSTIAIPLGVRGQTLGVLLGGRRLEQPFIPSEINFIESISAQTSIALENFRLLEEAQNSAREAHERNEELAIINRVVTAVSASLDLKSGLQAIIKELVDSFSLQSGEITLFNEGQTLLTIIAEHNRDDLSAIGTSFLAEEFPAIQQVLQTNKPVVVINAPDNPISRPCHRFLVDREIVTQVIHPLIVNQQVIGTIWMDLSDPNRMFTEQENRLTEMIVYQSSVAIQNAKLLEQAQNSLAETGLLYRISRAVSSSSTNQELLDLVVDHAMPHAADRVAFLFGDSDQNQELSEVELVAYRDRDGKFISSATRYSASQFPLLRNIHSDPFIILDHTSPEIDPLSKDTLDSLEFSSGCIIPLRTPSLLLGYMLVFSKAMPEISPKELRFLQITGDGIATALERQKLYHQAERRALELQTSARVAREITSTLDLDPLLKSIVNLLCERFGFYHASVFLMDEDGEYAVVRESTGLAGEEMKARGHKLAIGSRSIMGAVTATGQPLVVNDVSASDIHRKNPLLPNTQAELGIPLKIGERVIGALDVQSTHINAFHADDVAVLQILADQIAVAIENARAYALSQKAIEELRQVDQVKTKFLANMSHELRTPLNSIIGFSKVILKGIDGPVTDIQQQDLTAIYNSGQHLLRLINDILDVSKIEAGKMELSFDEIDLGEIVNSVMPTANGLVKDKQIKLVKNVPEDLPTVRADSMRIRQVLINLLSNAAKFTDRGIISVDASVQISTQNTQEAVIRVSDTGQGIPADMQRKLFQAFSQVDDSPTRKTGGTGLGLAICRSLIDMHGGKIGIEKSVLGEGSTFYFTLPVYTIKPSKIIGGTKAQTVLAIESDPKVIGLYRNHLEPLGFQIIPVTDSNLAGYHAQRLHPLAIIVDVTPRDHSGWKTIRQLRSDPATQTVPMILCSVFQEQELGFCLGMTEFLNKPLSPDQLSAIFNRFNFKTKMREVMVVDDQSDDLQIIQRTFGGQSNIFLTMAKDAWQAKALLARRRPHAVIMDLVRPDSYQLDFIKDLRANPTQSEVPIVFLLGLNRMQESIDQLDSFNQDLLAKLLSKPEEVLATLEHILKNIPVNRGS